MIPNTADYWRYIDDWRAVDFDRFNPADNSAMMQYPEYWLKRASGEIPAPPIALVRHNLSIDPKLGS
jgi:hypothetical protein